MGGIRSQPSDPDYRAATGTYHLRHDWNGCTELGTTLALAMRSIVDDLDGYRQLYDCLDPDALDTLFAPVSEEVPRETGAVSFRWAESSITVRGTGDVVIVPDRPTGDSEDGEGDA